MHAGEVVEQANQVWVSVPRVCESLGIDAANQCEKLKDKSSGT
jgi:hypothetical protein